MRLLRCSLLATVVIALPASAGWASASSKGQFGISPSRRSVVGNPPRRLTPTDLFNQTQTPIAVRVFPVLLSQALDGSFVTDETPRGLRDASLIFTVGPQTSFLMRPGSRRTIDTRWERFPSGTKAGAVGVIYQGVPQNQGGSVRNVTRLLNINLLQRPGPISSSGMFTKLRPAQIAHKLYLVARVKNAGQAIDSPKHGELLVRDGADRVVYRAPWVGDVVLPRAQRDFPLLINKTLPKGRYVGKVTMDFGSTHHARIIAPFTLVGPNQLPTADFAIRRFNATGEVGSAAHVTGLADGSQGTAPFRTALALRLFSSAAGASTTTPIAKALVPLSVGAGKQASFKTDVGSHLKAGAYRVEGEYRDAAGDEQSVVATFETTKKRSFFDRNRTTILIVVGILLLLLLILALLRRLERMRRELREARQAAPLSPPDPPASAQRAAEATTPSSGPEQPGAPLPPVDLNRAGVEELQRVPGIGPRAAQRIVEHREEYGEFRSVDDLSSVDGFDAERIAALRDRLSL